MSCKGSVSQTESLAPHKQRRVFCLVLRRRVKTACPAFSWAHTLVPNNPQQEMVQSMFSKLHLTLQQLLLSLLIHTKLFFHPLHEILKALPFAGQISQRKAAISSAVSCGLDVGRNNLLAKGSNCFFHMACGAFRYWVRKKKAAFHVYLVRNAKVKCYLYISEQ